MAGRVDVIDGNQSPTDEYFWQGFVTITSLQDMGGRFVGTERAKINFQTFSEAQIVFWMGMKLPIKRCWVMLKIYYQVLSDRRPHRSLLVQ